MELEYKGYTATEIKKDKRKNTTFLILIILPLLVGVFMLVGGFVELFTIKVESVEDVSYTTINTDTEYYFDEMILIDTYAHVSNEATGYVQMRDYIVSFTDADGKLIYTTIRTEGYSEFNEKCEAYIEDDSLNIGDVILVGCFHGYENGSSQVSEYLQEAYEICNEQQPGELLDWTFYYDDAESIEDYRSDRISNLLPLFFIALVIVVPCVIGIIVLIRKRKELDEYLTEQEERGVIGG